MHEDGMQHYKNLTEKFALSLEGPIVVVPFSEDPETANIAKGDAEQQLNRQNYIFVLM